MSQEVAVSRPHGQNGAMKDRRRIINDQLYAHFLTLRARTRCIRWRGLTDAKRPAIHAHLDAAVGCTFFL